MFSKPRFPPAGESLMRVCVGLDPGLVETGIVVMEMDYNTISTNLIRVEPSPAKRLHDIELAIGKILCDFPPKDVTVFIEGYAYGAKYQRESLAELGGVLRRFFYLHKLTYWVIPPLLNKQFVTGSARANKNYMKKCTKEKWGQHFKSDDVCDAYGLARLGVSTLRSIDKGAIMGYMDDHESKVIYEIVHNQGNYLEANTAKHKTKHNKHDKRTN